MTHIGIIRALEENDIPIDYITGTSMGAIIGSLYAMGYTPDEMEDLLRSPDFKRWYPGQVETKYEYYFKNQFFKDTETIPSSIRFSSQEECENFIKSFDTPFLKYIEDLLISDVHVNYRKILFMGNAINPRTHLKGYLGEWTNEDFYQFFEVTEEEKSLIEETISKFN